MAQEVDILITTKDRHSELAILMQCLRTQTYKKWNLFVLDNASGIPITQNYFLMNMFERIKMEGHQVVLLRNNIDFGVCYARNLLNKTQLEIGEGYYSMRLDDDVVLDEDYIEKLINVIKQGYDIASGVTPILGQPFFERETFKLNGKINEVEFDKEGNLIKFGDDCGYCYTEEKVLQAGHFRSCALYKSEINKIEYPDTLSKYGFREESFFSLKCRIKGYIIGVNTNAKALHFMTPSGGGRTDPNTFSQMCQQDDMTFRNWIKKKVLSGELKNE